MEMGTRRSPRANKTKGHRVVENDREELTQGRWSNQRMNAKKIQAKAEKTVILENSPENRRQACSLVFTGTLHIVRPCLEGGWRAQLPSVWER